MEQTKPSFFNRVAKFLKKVIWPTFAKVRQNTLIVMLYVVIVGIVIWGLDALFTWGMSLIISR